MNNYQKVIENISGEISWDNWKDEPCNGEKEYWEVPEVIYCRLDWLEEKLSGALDSDELDECLTTIKWCQNLMETLDDKGVKND